MARLFVVIPLLNEAQNVPRLLADLAESVAALDGTREVSVLLVDDGSTDGTADVARQHAGRLPVEVLVHDRNRGPGYAFGTAFAALAERLAPDDLVLTMEGDNTSRAELLATMLVRSREGHDAVFASPYMYGGGIVKTRTSRVVLSHLANGFVKEVLGVRGLLTVSSFYRLYRGSALQRLQAHYGTRVVERPGFESMVEMVMKMSYLEMTISEVPMILDTSRRIGASKLRVRRTALGYLALARRRDAWRSAATAGRAGG
jgi:dolichol-phosphate mannosyltransferase